MHYLTDAALFLLLVAALVAGGWAVSHREKSSFEAAFVPLAAFLGAYAFAVWAVGSIWKLVPTFWMVLPWPILALLLVWKRQNLQFHARRTLAALRNLTRLDAALAVYLTGLFALTFILSLAPPNAADYDSLTYHLAVPAHYLRVGKVVELPYDHHSYFPFTLEMLYTLGLWARGAVFAKLFHWLMLPLGALALVALGKRAHSARAGLLAAALFASMPLVLVEATTAYIDLGFCAFAWLALLCFAGAPSQNRHENWLWCGAFCGFCIGTKYFGWLVFGFLGLWFLVSTLQKREFSARKLAMFALPALLLGAPWYVRNMMWTGNPVFPFAYGIFGGRGWTAEMAALYDSSQAIYGFGRAPLDAGWVFWRLAMTPLNFRQPFWPLSGELVGGGKTGLFEVAGLALSSFPGPAVFALGLPALLGKNKPRSMLLASWFFAFLMAFWFVTSQQIRYLLPALGLLALVGGWGAAQNAPRFRVARWVGGAGLGLWLGFAPFWLVWHSRHSFGVLSGAQTPESYLRGFSGFDAMQWASNNTSPAAKFAVYGEPRTFYLHRNYFWADDEHNNLIAYQTLQNGAQLARALKNLGATHVLWNTDPGQNGGVFGPPQPLTDDAIARGDLILVYEDRRGYRIYAVR